MNWIELIASLIDSLAWPVVVVYVTYILKDRIGDLIPRLKKLKHKDTEIEFEQGIIELEKSVIKGEVATQKIEEKSKELKEKYDPLMQISEVSPRSAVLESFLLVEHSIAKALKKAYPEIKATQYFSPKNVEEMLKAKIITDQEAVRIRVLRRLRNTAAHAEDCLLYTSPSPRDS